MNDLLGVRAEGRGWFSNSAPNTDQFDHFEATLGLSFQFGGNNDIDGDGIVNRLDACPVTAEDKDGIDDTDGCVEEPPEEKDGDAAKQDTSSKDLKAAADKATQAIEKAAAPAPAPAAEPAAPAEEMPAPVVPAAAPASDCETSCKKDKSGADLDACLAKCSGNAKPESGAPFTEQTDAAVEDMEKEMKKADQ